MVQLRASHAGHRQKFCKLLLCSSDESQAWQTRSSFTRSFLRTVDMSVVVGSLVVMRTALHTDPPDFQSLLCSCSFGKETAQHITFFCNNFFIATDATSSFSFLQFFYYYCSGSLLRAQRKTVCNVVE